MVEELAEWLEYGGEDAGFHYCSHCKRQALGYDDELGNALEYLTNFCPHCGAKMKPVDQPSNREY